MLGELTLTKAGRGKVTVQLRDAGRLVATVSETFQDDKHYARAARTLGVDKAQLVEIIDEFIRSGVVESRRDLRPAGGDFTCYVRGRLRPVGESRPQSACDCLGALDAALGADVAGVDEPLIYWHGTDRLAALDVDYHHVEYGRRPLGAAARLAVEHVRPRPCRAWQTHGRGLRLVYAAQPPLAADELAAAAAVAVLSRDPLARCELKAVTRHPAVALPDGRTCSDVWAYEPDADVGALAAYLGRKDADPDEVAEWLTSRGMHVGGRYGHTHCPAQPDVPAGREPVSIQHDGVYCHACNGRGVSLGSRTPGWFPFTAILGVAVPSLLRGCVVHMAHWQHGAHVLRASLDIDDDLARAAYSAMLRVFHGDDPRVARCFTAGRNLVRFDRRWVTLQGETYTSDIRPLLAQLPACQVVRDNEVAVDPARVCVLDQPIDLAGYGYPALTPVWGFRIFGHRLPHRDPTQVPIVVPAKNLRDDCVASFRPKYAPGDLAEAWAALEETFPGLDRNAVLLLVAAKGVAEGEVGMPPMIFISGPTGSAKTSTVTLAAAVSGDSNHAVTWSPSVERVRQSLLAAKEQGSYATFNELVKEGRKGGLEKCMDFLLNLTPDSLSHKLYVGPVHLGSLPVVVFTDTSLPVEIKQNRQLARRLVHIHLSSRVDWESTLAGGSVGKVHNVRVADPRLAVACDTLLSHVVGRWFDRPRTFTQIAIDLGFSTLESCAEAVERDEVLVDFFRYVCVAPEPQGADARRWKGRGWRVISREQQSELAELWKSLHDEGDFGRSERCTEASWADMLKVPGPVVFESRSHGNKVAVRFVRRRSQSDYDVNQEVVDGVSGPRGSDRQSGSGDEEELGDGVSSVDTCQEQSGLWLDALLRKEGWGPSASL